MHCLVLFRLPWVFIWDIGFVNMNKESLTTILALLIAVVWSLVAISSVITKEYNSLGIITPVMLIVAGFLFGYKKNGNNK